MSNENTNQPNGVSPAASDTLTNELADRLAAWKRDSRGESHNVGPFDPNGELLSASYPTQQL